jgi:uncharacterized membrane protein
VKDIEDLLNEFMLNLNKVQNEFNISKQTGQSLEVYYKEKLLNQDENFHSEIFTMEGKHRNAKTSLEEEWKIKERIHEDKIKERNKAKEEMQAAEKEF